ncbi:MAG: hypothetical protein WAW31_06840 [Smithella sp.]
MSDEVCRYELNRKVRNILVSHNADMTKISYTNSNRTVCIYGSLWNNNNTDFNTSTVKALVSDLMNIPRVNSIQFDLDNWVIVADPGELVVMKGKESERLPWGKDKDDPFL